MIRPAAAVGQMRDAAISFGARLRPHWGSGARDAVGSADRARHVILFSLSLLVAALAGWVLVVRGLQPVPAPVTIPWPLLAVCFAVAERFEVSIHFRRERHSFSLSEIPAVVGLFCLTPNEYVLAHMLGSGAALLTTSGASSLKLLFNLSHFALAAVLALSVFYAVGPTGAALGIDDWLAAFLAMLSTTVLGALAVATVITLSGGAPQYQKLPEMLQFGGLAAVANTSVALLAITVMSTNPSSVWLLAIPAVAVFIANRAYVSERDRHERLELLYQSSRILQHSPELDLALVDLLEHARAMFRAELAEISLRVPDQDQVLRTTAVLDGAPEAMVVEDWHAGDVLWDQIERRMGVFLLVPDNELEIGGRRIQQAMVAPLVGESGLSGRIVIANRLTEGTPFASDDLRLFETLANQAAVALENGQLEKSLTELSRLKEQLHHMAYHDSLTGLANRALFSDEVEARLRAPTDERSSVVLFLDLDDFKVVNDTLGHAAGDELLTLVAQRLATCLRGDDLAARLGGDEFAVLLSDGPDMAAAIAVAARIQDALQAPFMIGGQEVLVGASIGIATASGAGIRADELLRNADVAMYTAKAEGKHRAAVFDPGMHSAIVARHAMSADLARAIMRREFEVYYQPIVVLATGAVVGFEALLRWRHPTRGLVGPDEFIRLAEENGSILEIGRWVLTEACLQTAAWQRMAGTQEPLMISVNVASQQVQQPGFVAEVERAIDESGIDPACLVLELTEGAMFQDTKATTTRLEQLRARGVRIALDDFGTGYSSLGYLRRFPVDILKIARDFVAPPEADQDEWAFAAAIVALGRTLGLTIVAEGIEKPGQLDRLRLLGCELGQGYLFARPADPAVVGRTFVPGAVAGTGGSGRGAGTASATTAPLVAVGGYRRGW
jgi:diguanylate cyclase (GGDEF)-like protein